MLYPLLFESNLHNLVWGTESWEVSAVPSSPSIVANGPLKGLSVISVTNEYGSLLLGNKVAEEFQGKFPLLVKFIDAKKDLSIQVHPNDELAMKRHNCFGKTEMWYIIDAEPGASILAGFKESITSEEYKKKVADGTIVDSLARHEVHPGDVFYIPAGRIHAICGGVYLAEVQQSSDITYRLYDYKRPGLDGKPRELHTELASDAIDYNVIPDYRTYYGSTICKAAHVVDTPFFNVRVMDLTRTFHRNLMKYDSFVISMCITGSCKITIRDNDNLDTNEREIILRSGSSCLIPACLTDYDITPLHPGTRILEAHLDRKNNSLFAKTKRALGISKK